MINHARSERWPTHCVGVRFGSSRDRKCARKKRTGGRGAHVVPLVVRVFASPKGAPAAASSKVRTSAHTDTCHSDAEHMAMQSGRPLSMDPQLHRTRHSARTRPPVPCRPVARATPVPPARNDAVSQRGEQFHTAQMPTTCSPVPAESNTHVSLLGLHARETGRLGQEGGGRRKTTKIQKVTELGTGKVGVRRQRQQDSSSSSSCSCCCSSNDGGNSGSGSTTSRTRNVPAQSRCSLAVQ